MRPSLSIPSITFHKGSPRPRLALAWGIAWRMALGAVAFVLLVTILFRFVNPPLSSEMLRAQLFGEGVRQEWVSLEDISPNLIRAVIVAEDGRFCQHGGVDWRQVEQAWQEALEGDKPPRGASTITMQLVKNLYLWSNRSYVRKALEVPIAFVTDVFWSKRRQIEVYLNIVEWGPGIYGAKAAAAHHFKTQPSRLTARQAAQMAAALPNPIERRAGRPGPYTRRIAGIIYKRMRGAGPYVQCALP